SGPRVITSVGQGRVADAAADVGAPGAALAAAALRALPAPFWPPRGTRRLALAPKLKGGARLAIGASPLPLGALSVQPAAAAGSSSGGRPRCRGAIAHSGGRTRRRSGRSSSIWCLVSRSHGSAWAKARGRNADESSGRPAGLAPQPGRPALLARRPPE